MDIIKLIQSLDLDVGELSLWAVTILTLIQIAPVKVDPWSWIAKKVGRAINGEVLEKFGELEKNQKTAEKDALRTQLLMMIADYPEEKTEILKLSEYYFANLHGNWTATAIFNHWLEKYCDGAKPEWFKGDRS